MRKARLRKPLSASKTIAVNKFKSTHVPVFKEPEPKAPKQKRIEFTLGEEYQNALMILYPGMSVNQAARRHVILTIKLSTPPQIVGSSDVGKA